MIRKSYGVTRGLYRAQDSRHSHRNREHRERAAGQWSARTTTDYCARVGYEFGVVSVKVIPSLHNALDHKHYFSSAKAPEGMKAPLTVRQMMPEGGTLAYLIRLHDHQILAFGGQ